MQIHFRELDPPSNKICIAKKRFDFLLLLTPLNPTLEINDIFKKLPQMWQWWAGVKLFPPPLKQQNVENAKRDVIISHFFLSYSDIFKYFLLEQI